MGIGFNDQLTNDEDDDSAGGTMLRGNYVETVIYIVLQSTELNLGEVEINNLML